MRSQGVVQSAEGLVAELLGDAQEDLLPGCGGRPIFGPPVVGVADGDDDLFVRFRSVVADRHLMPRELLAGQSRPGADLSRVRVVVWVLPFTEEVRRSNRGGREPSRMYSLARNNGGALNFALRRDVAAKLRSEGWAAAAPLLTDGYGAFRCQGHTFSSSWSERHAAYAAGLGQFGLNGSLITPVGASARIGSVVTNAPVPVTPRTWSDHRAPCLATGGAVCGRCVERCPAGAVGPDGLDKERCYEMRGAIRERHMDAYVRELDMLPAPIVKGGVSRAGHSLGCALCQCGVPCEAQFPEFESIGNTRCVM